MNKRIKLTHPVTIGEQRCLISALIKFQVHNEVIITYFLFISTLAWPTSTFLPCNLSINNDLIIIFPLKSLFISNLLLYYTTLHCTALHYTILYYTIPYHTVFHLYFL